MGEKRETVIGVTDIDQLLAFGIGILLGSLVVWGIFSCSQLSQIVAIIALAVITMLGIL